MKTEKALYQALKTNLPKVHWQRIEVGSLGTGVPDVNACWQGKEVWIELKLGSLQSINLSPQQCAWHMRRANAGGVSWILSYDHSKRELWLIPGIESINLRERTLSSSDLIHHQSSPFDWKVLIKKICMID